MMILFLGACAFSFNPFKRTVKVEEAHAGFTCCPEYHSTCLYPDGNGGTGSIPHFVYFGSGPCSY